MGGLEGVLGGCWRGCWGVLGGVGGGLGGGFCWGGGKTDFFILKKYMKHLTYLERKKKENEFSYVHYHYERTVNIFESRHYEQLIYPPIHLMKFEEVDNNDKVQVHKIYAKKLLEQIEKYGVPEKRIPSIDEIINSLENKETGGIPYFKFLGGSNYEEFHGMGYFWEDFYLRLGKWETLKDYCKRTGLCDAATDLFFNSSARKSEYYYRNYEYQEHEEDEEDEEDYEKD